MGNGTRSLARKKPDYRTIMIEMNGIMKTVTAAALSLSAACLTGPAAGAGTPGNEAGDKNLSVHSISMNRICKEWDGQW